MRIKLIMQKLSKQRWIISRNFFKLLLTLFTMYFLSGCSVPVVPTQREVSFRTIPVDIKKYDAHKVAAAIGYKEGLTLVTISNGTSTPIQVKSISIAGDKCTYVSTKNEEIGPGFSISYKAPEIGLVGLCYNNNEQIHFIKDIFLGIDNETGDKDIRLVMEVVWTAKNEEVGEKGDDVGRIIQNHTLNFSTL